MSYSSPNNTYDTLIKKLLELYHQQNDNIQTIDNKQNDLSKINLENNFLKNVIIANDTGDVPVVPIDTFATSLRYLSSYPDGLNLNLATVPMTSPVAGELMPLTASYTYINIFKNYQRQVLPFLEYEMSFTSSGNRKMESCFTYNEDFYDDNTYKVTSDEGLVFNYVHPPIFLTPFTWETLQKVSIQYYKKIWPITLDLIVGGNPEITTGFILAWTTNPYNVSTVPGAPGNNYSQFGGNVLQDGIIESMPFSGGTTFTATGTLTIVTWTHDGPLFLGNPTWVQHITTSIVTGQIVIITNLQELVLTPGADVQISIDPTTIVDISSGGYDPIDTYQDYLYFPYYDVALQNYFYMVQTSPSSFDMSMGTTLNPYQALPLGWNGLNQALVPSGNNITFWYDTYVSSITMTPLNTVTVEVNPGAGPGLLSTRIDSENAITGNTYADKTPVFVGGNTNDPCYIKLSKTIDTEESYQVQFTYIGIVTSPGVATDPQVREQWIDIYTNTGGDSWGNTSSIHNTIDMPLFGPKPSDLTARVVASIRPPINWHKVDKFTTKVG